MLADTQRVDVRRKTFAGEAIKQLGFLQAEHGFAGPDVEREASPGTTVRVRYRRDGITIEASLVLWYMGEQYVATTHVVGIRDGAALRTEIGRNTAHTGYQMRRALKLQAETVRAAMRRPRQLRVARGWSRPRSRPDSLQRGRPMSVPDASRRPLFRTRTGRDLEGPWVESRLPSNGSHPRPPRHRHPSTYLC